ncbi:hypothetical protein Sango_3040200 [Sesamum angolense]|uniref:DUF4283 domain-containing protein n=1 Tax=Sesamum angolense TaxID=2727404 RepID=A0AAE1TCH9_9LAMI|nr:hypothetical protein Sango_3040200 [Sesamum angolense]
MAAQHSFSPTWKPNDWWLTFGLLSLESSPIAAHRIASFIAFLSTRIIPDYGCGGFGTSKVSSIRVFKWSPTFTPDQQSFIIPICVSFPELPAHLFHKDAIFSIASIVGTPLQMADSTYNQSKLSRARVCIEVDLLKPLLEEFDLQIQDRKIVQKIEYEQIPRYCSLCKHVGHQDLECYSKSDATKPLFANELMKKPKVLL